MGFSPSAALSLLLLASCAFAASPFEAFLAYSFEPDDGVAYSPLLCGGNYYIVSAGGRETYVVDGTNGSAVLDLNLLSSLLAADAQNRTGFEAQVSSAKAFPSLVNAAKQANEAKCLQYIGDDSDPGCNDRQSCLVSCFSVPQCEIIVQSDGFLEAMMDWDSKRKEYSSALEAYSEGIDSIRFDQQSVDAKLSLLSSLSSLAANMSQNSIFLARGDAACAGKNATLRCYEYCPQIDYSASLISAQSQNLASLKPSISTIAGQGARAEAILNRSAENNAYLSSRGKGYEDFRIMMSNSIRSLKAKSIELAKGVKDPDIAPMISQLENISLQAENYSTEGYYKKALALRNEFEPLSSAASARIDSEGAQYASLMLEMERFSEKAKSSAWLIGNQSSDAYIKRLSSLKADYEAPLSPFRIYSANATLSALSTELASEIAAKAVQAGNASQLPQQPAPSVQQSPIAIPDFVWFAAIALAAALVYAFILRSARRTAPKAPKPPFPTQ